MRYERLAYVDRVSWSGMAGQSGDNQALERTAETDSESVEELAEEGQDFEAEVINSIERAAYHRYPKPRG